MEKKFAYTTYDEADPNYKRVMRKVLVER